MTQRVKVQAHGSSWPYYHHSRCLRHAPLNPEIHCPKPKYTLNLDRPECTVHTRTFGSEDMTEGPRW